MSTGETRVDVLVVGAGVSGLLAARALVDAGRSVAVVDKGRGVGGRLATRRIATGRGVDARLDHGAQFFTVRTERFASLVEALVADGIVHEWCRGFGPQPDGHPRYAVRDGMTALAKHLAGPLDVTTACRLAHVRPGPHDVVATADDGRTWVADRAIVTAPAPQSMELLGEASPSTLTAIAYEPTLCLLGLLDRRSTALGPVGALQRPEGSPFEFVADNAARGSSVVPALTAHLTAAESARRWDDPDEDTLAFALDAVQPFLDGAAVSAVELKRWRYATPSVLHPDPCLVEGPVAFAGDAFGSPRVEGAATSGWAAAEALLAG